MSNLKTGDSITLAELVQHFSRIIENTPRRNVDPLNRWLYSLDGRDVLLLKKLLDMCDYKITRNKKLNKQASDTLREITKLLAPKIGHKKITETELDELTDEFSRAFLFMIEMDVAMMMHRF